MPPLHEALATLGPIDYATVPLDSEGLRQYVQEHLSAARLLVDSVPPPPAPGNGNGRGRASTVGGVTAPAATGASPSGASTKSNMSASAVLPDLSAPKVVASAAKPEPASPASEALQSEWGKPVKIAAKDNPLNIPVYKLSARDGRGAWFARRSVHEGLSFSRWKDAIQREFPTSLAVQGQPGEGNVRGIGADQVLEEVDVPALARLDVYRLSAQFPGPTTPRDFVELLLTSSSSSTSAEDDGSTSRSSSPPHATSAYTKSITGLRSFIVISKPCKHPAAQPTSDFIRGAYESIELIRELPTSHRKRASISAQDIKTLAAEQKAQLALARDAMFRRAQTKPSDNEAATRSSDDLPAVDSGDDSSTTSARVKADASPSRRSNGVEIDAPVEWIQITRSDPGGSVPRFMVERGTPGSIVADANKFAEWACSLPPIAAPESTPNAANPSAATEEVQKPALASISTTSLPTDLTKVSTEAEAASPAQKANGQTDAASGTEISKADEATEEEKKEDGLLATISGAIPSVAAAAYARLETYAPRLASPLASAILPSNGDVSNSTSSQAASNEHPGSQHTKRHHSSSLSITSSTSSDQYSVSSGGSFTSAKASHENLAIPAESSAGPAQGSKEAALHAMHAARLAQLAADHAEAQVKHANDAKKLEKAETQHAKAIDKAEAQRRKALGNLSAQRAKVQREAQKAQEKAQREAEKAERKKAEREQREKEREAREAKKQLEREEKKERNAMKEEIKNLGEEAERLRRDRDALQVALGNLQAENTALVARVESLEGGKELVDSLRSGDGGAAIAIATVVAETSAGDAVEHPPEPAFASGTAKSVKSGSIKSGGTQ